MRAPPLTPSLQLCSRIGVPARVRLHCGGRCIWDAWVPAAGAIRSPALAPRSITLWASVTEAPTCVSRSASLHDVPGHGRYAVSLRQDRGALLLVLSAATGEGGDDVAGLCLANTTSWAMDYRLAICASPYEMSGHLEPGASLVDIWAGPLGLDVIVEGRSVSLPLAAAAGRWLIEASAEPLGFRVVAREGLPSDTSFPRSPA